MPPCSSSKGGLGYIAGNHALGASQWPSHISAKSRRNKPGIRLINEETAFAEAQPLDLLMNHKVFHGITAETLRGKTLIDTGGTWSRLTAN